MMFGDNRKGACGIERNENKQIHVPLMMRGKRMAKVSCGGLHCMGINEKGRIYSWGSNRSGQLGRVAEDGKGEEKSGQTPNII